MTRDKAQSILERYSEGCYFCRPLEDLLNYIYDDFEQQIANLNSNLEAQEIVITDYKKHIEELEDSIYAKSKQVDELKAQRMELWMLLDNIDTSEDIAKDSDKLFRNLCRNEYPKRWDIYEPNDIERISDD